MRRMTAREVMQIAGSPNGAARLAKEKARLALEAIKRNHFSEASTLLRDASDFAGVLACVQGQYERMHGKRGG